MFIFFQFLTRNVQWLKHTRAAWGQKHVLSTRIGALLDQVNNSANCSCAVEAHTMQIVGLMINNAEQEQNSVLFKQHIALLFVQHQIERDSLISSEHIVTFLQQCRFEK